jgi:hypothetical protein
VDGNALSLQWKVRVLEFDEDSPISSSTIVRITVGLLAFALAKSALKIATRP